MELLTSAQIQNHWGYRDFEVRNMDITDYEEKYDILVISAFKDSYIPTPNTLVEAIYKKWNIDLDKLSKRPYFDFRKNMGAWIAEVPLQGVPFRYILCVEMIGTNQSLEHSFTSIFALLSAIEAMDSSKSFKTIVSPLLGTGNQGIPVNDVCKTLINVFDSTKDTVRSLKKIVLIERNKSKAEILLSGIEEVLSRKIKLKLPEEMIQRVRPSLLSILEKLGNKLKYQKWTLDMKEQLNREMIDVFTIGNLGRRIIEIIISEIYEKEKKKEKEFKDLYEKINNLSNLKYSQWFIEYLHIMRIFGNESSHEKRNEDRLPRQLSNDDLSVLMMCMVRVLEIWVEKEKSMELS